MLEGLGISGFREFATYGATMCIVLPVFRLLCLMDMTVHHSRDLYHVIFWQEKKCINCGKLCKNGSNLGTFYEYSMMKFREINRAVCVCSKECLDALARSNLEYNYKWAGINTAYGYEDFAVSRWKNKWGPKQMTHITNSNL